MYGWFLLGNNVAGSIFNMLVVAFFAMFTLGIGFMIYAAKQLKKAEDAAENKAE